MSTAPRTQCKATRRDGQPCQAFAIGTAGYCISHDPAKAGQMAAARRKGGAARHGRKIGTTGTGSPVALVELKDVLDLLGRVAADLYQLENSVSRGRALVSLATAWAGCFETSEMEARISALEKGVTRGN